MREGCVEGRRREGKKGKREKLVKGGGEVEKEEEEAEKN